MDGVDWQHEIGEAAGGNTVYPSINDLKENNKCWKSCGIVECEITFKKWSKNQDLFGPSTNTVVYNKEEMEKNRDIVLLEGLKKHLKYLEDRAKKLKKRIDYHSKKVKKKGNKNVIKSNS